MTKPHSVAQLVSSGLLNSLHNWMTRQFTEEDRWDDSQSSSPFNACLIPFYSELKATINRLFIPVWIENCIF